MLQAHQPPPEALELRLTPSSPNSSITASNSMEGRSIHCRSSEDDDEGYMDNIPHLMSEASDDEGPEYIDWKTPHSKTNADRFGAMLQQQREQVNYLDDSNASVVFVGGEADQLSARTESPIRGARKNLASKMSRSRDSQSSTPVMMMVDLDDDDDDADIPSMLTEANLGTKIFTSAGPLAAPEPRHVKNLPPQPPPTPCSAQLHRTASNASHQRSSSSLSSSSSQSSFRSILRNGGAAKRGTVEGRSPLVTRSANKREANNDGRGVMATPHRPVALDKENPQGLEARKLRGSRSERKHRGRSVEKRSRSKSRRSVSYSSASKSEGRSEKNHLTNRIDGGESKAHRRTVSFPAELVQMQKPIPRSNSRSPVASALGQGADFDPALVPILDTKRARKASSHVRNGTNISPRTADFLAHDSPAVIAMCRAQDRERQHHAERPRFPELATERSLDDADKPRSPGHAPTRTDAKEVPSPLRSKKLVPKNSAEEAFHRLNPCMPPISQGDSSCNSLRSTSSGSSGDSVRVREPKRRFFKFSASDRKGKISFRRKSLHSIVGLLSPVDEMGEGSTTCGLTPTTLTPTTLEEPVSADADEVVKKSPKKGASNDKGSVSVPATTSSKGSAMGNRDLVSPVSNELQKAANFVWGENIASSSSAASRGGKNMVDVGCTCVIL